jgi:hypothetical protein
LIFTSYAPPTVSIEHNTGGHVAWEILMSAFAADPITKGDLVTTALLPERQSKTQRRLDVLGILLIKCKKLKIEDSALEKSTLKECM